MPNMSAREIGLIKGVLAYTNLNDQQVLSIFSQLHRDLNSRDIGYIRKDGKDLYKRVPACSEAEVRAFMACSERRLGETALLGIGELDQSERQVYKAIDLMKTAITIFNSGTLITRSETFIVLSIIAWTYLLHAKLRKVGIEPIYTDDSGVSLLGPDGQEKLWDLAQCLKESAADLTQGEVRNLRYLIAVRNAIEHRSTDDINDDVQSKCQACALNFAKYCAEKFGPRFDFASDVSFAIQLQPLTLGATNLPRGGAPKSGHIETINRLLESEMSPEDYNDLSYAFRVYVVPKVTNNSKKADQAVTYSPLGSNVEVAIKQVERPKYRQKEILAFLKENGLSLTSTQFQRLWMRHKLKEKGKGLAVQIGGQWFWYEDVLTVVPQLIKNG